MMDGIALALALFAGTPASGPADPWATEQRRAEFINALLLDREPVTIVLEWRNHLARPGRPAYIDRDGTIWRRSMPGLLWETAGNANAEHDQLDAAIWRALTRRIELFDANGDGWIDGDDIGPWCKAAASGPAGTK